MSSGQSGAGFNFNEMQQVKSHSSVLYNERMAIQFYLLDMNNLMMNQIKTPEYIYKVHSILRQIYKNIRMLLRFNPTVRATMNLETKEEGVYTIDVAMDDIKKKLRYCENFGFTYKRIEILIEELESAEMLIKDVMQYFQYFIRPDFKQKPDIDKATEQYKEMADKKTVEQLKEVIGKSYKADFESLGTERVELEEDKSEFDPAVDGTMDEYIEEDDKEQLEIENDSDDDE